MSQNLRIFCPLLGTVHYWGLLLNKNGWEAGFCPLLGAFPLLGSALLREYSVHFCIRSCNSNCNTGKILKEVPKRRWHWEISMEWHLYHRKYWGLYESLCWVFIHWVHCLDTSNPTEILDLPSHLTKQLQKGSLCSVKWTHLCLENISNFLV